MNRYPFVWRIPLIQAAEVVFLPKTAFTAFGKSLPLPHVLKLNNFPEYTCHLKMIRSRGLWTWLPWVACPPAFNHWNGRVSGFLRHVLYKVSQVEAMGSRQATPRNNVFQKVSKVAPLQDNWPTNPTTAYVINRQCGLAMFSMFPVIPLQ